MDLQYNAKATKLLVNVQVAAFILRKRRSWANVLVYRALSLKDVAVALIASWYGVPEKPYALANFDESKRYAESL